MSGHAGHVGKLHFTQGVQCEHSLTDRFLVLVTILTLGG